MLLIFRASFGVSVRSVNHLNDYMTVLHYPVKRSALAKTYKVSKNTFTIWLRDVGIKHGRTLTPADLRKIIANYELPDGVEIKWV